MPQQPIEKMRQAVLDDAEKKSQRILKNAQTEIDKLIKDVESKVMEERTKKLQQAQQQSESISKTIIAEAQTDFFHLWLTQRENVILQSLTKTMDIIAQMSQEQKQASIKKLIIEALITIGPQASIISLNTQNAELITTKEINEIKQLLPPEYSNIEIKIIIDSQQEDGPIIKSKDQHCLVNNCYLTRLKRMKEDLRAYACEKIPNDILEAPKLI